MAKNNFEQYKILKAKHPDALLLFRCGDFYESYDDDAEDCARVLGITLTHNIKQGEGEPTKKSSFPWHALDSYLPRLIRAGHRIAICDEIEQPKPKKSIDELLKK